MSLTKGHRCCGTNIGRADGKGPPPTLSRRIFKITEWLIPGVILALLPKCPLCIVAYVAVGTGIGLSVSTASGARTLALFACIAALTYAAAKQIYRQIVWFWSPVEAGKTAHSVNDSTCRFYNIREDGSL